MKKIIIAALILISLNATAQTKDTSKCKVFIVDTLTQAVKLLNGFKVINTDSTLVEYLSLDSTHYPMEGLRVRSEIIIKKP